MSDISYVKRNGIAFAIYQRPEALNAFRNKTYNELHTILLDFVEDDESQILILSGTGRAFSAGQDLKELSATDFLNVEKIKTELKRTQEITRLLHQTNKPTIAAINGLAVGFGVEIALACTVRIAAEEAYFQFAEVKRGLFQTNGTLYFLPRLVGLGRAAHMLLSGEKIFAEEALSAGLITRKVAADQLMSMAENLASEFLQGSMPSLHLVQQGLRMSIHGSLEDIMEFEIESNLALIQGKEQLKGLQNFVEGKTTNVEQSQ